ncbi:MAG: hypothetical protein COB53_13385 [Elusimicrobia bacterium]|nr:MAG: hypothetical protein COB53_13385 [Elusimicrobiota bacterium]
MQEQFDFHTLLTWFLSRKSLHLDAEGPWVVSMIAKNIAYSYSALPKTKAPLEKITVNIEKIKDKDYLGNEAQYLSSVLKLKEFVVSNIKEHVVDFLIHGSVSTLDYVKGWSDLDTLVILKSKTITNPLALMDLREKLHRAHDYLLALDPLQHHGFIFCTEFDLNQYLSHCMPVAVLQESKSLIDGQFLTLAQRRSTNDIESFFAKKVALFKRSHQSGILQHHEFEGKYLQESYKDMNTMNQMKYFLSIVMSLPIYYLDAIGEPCYKKESFNRVKPDFVDDWEMIERASEVRQIWGEKETIPHVGNDIPLWLPEVLGDRYFERAHNIAKLMLDNLVSKSIRAA